MTTQKERFEKAMKEFETENQTLEQCVKTFLSILDVREESDSGGEFSPVYISNCRVYYQPRLGYLLTKMRELTKND